MVLRQMLCLFIIYYHIDNSHFYFLQVNVLLTILIKEIWMKKTAQEIVMANVLVFCTSHRYPFVVSATTIEHLTQNAAYLGSDLVCSGSASKDVDKLNN